MTLKLLWKPSIGVETVYSAQIALLVPAREIMGDRDSLWILADDLPDDVITEVLDLAEFLKQKKLSVEK